MESINFDYFADRAVLLTEMARTASLPGVKYPEIVQAYGNARKIGKQIGGITSMDDFSYGYMAYIIDDFLTPEQQRQYDTTTNVNAKIPLVKSLLIDVLNKNPDRVGEIASQMSSEDNVRQYHQIYKSTKGQSGRSKGAKTIISDVGGIDPDDLTALENELAPYLKQMNKSILLNPKKILNHATEISPVQDPVMSRIRSALRVGNKGSRIESLTIWIPSRLNLIVDICPIGNPTTKSYH